MHCSILGVRSDSSDETIRRYYKRQAVLVHPDKNLIVGAEEAFKILARAFEMVGDPIKRTEYHQKLMEAQAKEKFCGEIGNLLEQLRKKMEAASSTIRYDTNKHFLMGTVRMVRSIVNVFYDTDLI